MVKENFEVSNLAEYQSRIHEGIGLSELQGYLQPLFVEIQDSVSGLNMQFHLLRSMDFTIFDETQKNFLQGCLRSLQLLEKKVSLAVYSLKHGYPNIDPISDPDFSYFVTQKQNEFEKALATCDQITDEEFLDIIDGEFRYLFASVEQSLSSLSFLQEKEELFPVSEEAFLTQNSLRFLVQFFGKWLENKGFFLL